MRILIDARYLDGSYSGIATYSRCLVENLARIDQDNEYLVVVRPGFRENLALGPNFQVLSLRPRPVSFQSYLGNHRFYRPLGVDLIHALSPQCPIFYDGPQMVTVHDLQPFVDPEFSGRRPRVVRTAYNLFYRWAYPAALSHSKWILCDSYATRDDIARMFPREIPKLIVVRPGIDAARHDPPPQEQVDAIRAKFDLRSPYLLYYGSTRPNKNLPRLVEAFAQSLEQLRDDQLELVLVLGRDRFFRDLERAIARTNISPRIRLLDPLKPNEQRALLRGALAFVFPTKYEGFGFPPLEAMACGTPVLAGESGALPEVVANAAVLVDPDDLESISSGICRLASDERLRNRLREAGLRRVGDFDWAESAERVRDIYRLLF